MKRTILITLACLPALAFSQTTKFTIDGGLDAGLNSPAKVYLEYFPNGKTVKDSATVKDGKFHFGGTLDSADPVMGYLILKKEGAGPHTRDYTQIYLEKGIIKVSSPDSLNDATIEGTPTNDDNATYHKLMKPVDAAYDSLEKVQDAATPEQKQSDDFQRSINQKEKEIEGRESVLNKKFIQDHPNSYLCMNVLENYAYGADYADIAPLFNGLSPQVKATEAGKKFAERLPVLKSVALGATAPEFTEADTSGKMISLASFRGKYVLVDFWASWCGPCRHENPNVVRAYNRFKDQNFTIIGVSLDQPNGKQRWLNAIHHDGLTWTQVSDLKFWNSKTAALYGVRGIPANFLIDPNGKIIAKNLRGNDLEDKLAQIFGKS